MDILFEFKEQDDMVCDACSEISFDLTLIESAWSATNLCGNCMQELNRKIVEYLADKNI